MSRTPAKGHGSAGISPIQITIFQFVVQQILDHVDAIGVAKPLSIYADIGGNPNKIDAAKLETVLGELMDLSPRGIRKHLDLNKPIYARTSAYGHFGRDTDKDGGFSWERTDLASKLKSAMA
jgi:S-adenosylmethionine synthetase